MKILLKYEKLFVSCVGHYRQILAIPFVQRITILFLISQTVGNWELLKQSHSHFDILNEMRYK